MFDEMLSIGRHTDYAARLVLHLAALKGTAQVTIREVARERLLPVPFVRRLVSRLIKAGILATSRGAGGGIRLARPASEISLLEIVEAMEGRLVLNRCVNGGLGCPLSSSCPIRGVWNRVNGEMRASLAGVRFDSLANAPRHMAAHRARHEAARETVLRRGRRRNPSGS